MKRGKIERVFLEYRGDAIGLVSGENMVGRHVDCRIRFNDPAVSRRHMRFLVMEDRVVAEDLGSSNGSLVNSHPLTEAVDLQDGDVIEVGQRSLRIVIVTREMEEEEIEETENRGLGWATDATDRMDRPTPIHGNPAVGDLLRAQPISDLEAQTMQQLWAKPHLPAEHVCPRCHAKVPFEQDTCPKCSYQWPAGRPSSVTQPIRISDIKKARGAERRKHKRVVVDIPVVYSSEMLGFDASARDLSRGGVFLATDLLDEPGTTCHVTLLPDGGQAVTFNGIVRRVVQSHTTSGDPPGMGIEFIDLSTSDQGRLDDLAGAHGA